MSTMKYEQLPSEKRSRVHREPKGVCIEAVPTKEWQHFRYWRAARLEPILLNIITGREVLNVRAPNRTGNAIHFIDARRTILPNRGHDWLLHLARNMTDHDLHQGGNHAHKTLRAQGIALPDEHASLVYALRTDRRVPARQGSTESDVPIGLLDPYSRAVLADVTKALGIACHSVQ